METNNGKFIKLRRGVDRDLRIAFYTGTPDEKTPLDLTGSTLTMCVYSGKRVLRFPGEVEGDDYNICRILLPAWIDAPEELARFSVYRQIAGRTEELLCGNVLITGDRPNV